MILARAMRERADADLLPQDHALRQAADEFDAATTGAFALKPTVTVGEFFAAWARARTIWCRHTGEPLI